MTNSIRGILGVFYHATLDKAIYRIKLDLYWLNLPRKIKKIRAKEKIKVLFINSTLTSWKTEMLYERMLNNKRFIPILGISTNRSYSTAKGDLINYLNSKKYSYVDLDSAKNSIAEIAPDIIFYASPYPENYSKGHYFDKNLQYVFCGVDYCFNITKHEAHLSHPWYDYCWQFYVEHNDVLKRKVELLGKKAYNIKVTGVPMQDLLLLDKKNFSDPWHDKTGKKRIIYAPHHSFKGFNGDGIEFATFMEYGDFMLKIAEEFKDKITIAFKPHGLLYPKLLKTWGQERTDAYYKKWQEMSNTQYENGEYVGLFKYSDAIIHDCASFIVEYLYVNKPGLYLVAESNHTDDMFDFVKDCYNSYTHAFCEKDIRTFIIDVINENDSRHNERKSCISNHLIPPSGQSACDNIMNAIIG